MRSKGRILKQPYDKNTWLNDYLTVNTYSSVYALAFKVNTFWLGWIYVFHGAQTRINDMCTYRIFYIILNCIR